MMVELIARKHPTKSAALNEQEAALEVIGAGLGAPWTAASRGHGTEGTRRIRKMVRGGDQRRLVYPQNDTVADVDGLVLTQRSCLLMRE